MDKDLDPPEAYVDHDEDLLHFQSVVVRSTETNLDGPPDPEESELLEIHEDYAYLPVKRQYKLCEHCETPVHRGEPHVRVRYSIDYENPFGRERTHSAIPVFCDQACWTAWSEDA